jgi:hypothetical protein
MPEHVIDAIRGILRRARDTGSRVVLVVPALAPRAVRVHGDLDAAHVELHRGLEAAMDGQRVPVLDLHAPEGFSDAQFYDPWHLHGSMAEPFSRLLAREIAALEGSPQDP